MEIFLVLIFIAFLTWMTRFIPSKGNPFTRFIKDKERKKQKLKRRGIDPDRNEVEFMKNYEGSDSYQSYVRKQKEIKLKDQKLLISELKNNKDKSKEEKKALLKKLAKKRVDQLNSEKQEPADRSSSSQIYGKRGGRFRYRTSKNGKLYRQYY